MFLKFVAKPIDSTETTIFSFLFVSNVVGSLFEKEVSELLVNILVDPFDSK